VLDLQLTSNEMLVFTPSNVQFIDKAKLRETMNMSVAAPDT